MTPTEAIISVLEDDTFRILIRDNTNEASLRHMCLIYWRDYREDPKYEPLDRGMITRTAKLLQIGLSLIAANMKPATTELEEKIRRALEGIKAKQKEIDE